MPVSTATPPTPVTLTDRYVAAATRGLTDQDRGELERELRSSVADAVADRVEAGESPATAERAVLNGLGDPDVLSARYRGRSLYLIGPRFYPEWARLVRLLLIWVLPIVALVSAAVRGVEEASVGAAIGGFFGGVFTLGVHLLFWSTLAFFVLDRTNTDIGLGPWTVDRLPVPGFTERVVELVLSVIAPIGLAAAIVWQQMVGFVQRDGAAVPLLNPELWTSWIPVFLLAMAVAVVVAGLRFRTRRVSTGVLVGSVVRNLLGYGAIIVPAAQARLLDPRFLAAAGPGVTDSTWQVVHTLIALFGGVCLVWSLVDAVRRHRRDRLPT